MTIPEPLHRLSRSVQQVIRRVLVTHRGDDRELQGKLPKSIYGLCREEPRELLLCCSFAARYRATVNSSANTVQKMPGRNADPAADGQFETVIEL